MVFLTINTRCSKPVKTSKIEFKHQFEKCAFVGYVTQLYHNARYKKKHKISQIT